MSFAAAARAAQGAPAATPTRLGRPPSSPPVRRARAVAAAAACEPVEAILFDMDGVLTLSEELSRE